MINFHVWAYSPEERKTMAKIIEGLNRYKGLNFSGCSFKDVILMLFSCKVTVIYLILKTKLSTTINKMGNLIADETILKFEQLIQ